MLSQYRVTCAYFPTSGQSFLGFLKVDANRGWVHHADRAPIDQGQYDPDDNEGSGFSVKCDPATGYALGHETGNRAGKRGYTPTGHAHTRRKGAEGDSYDHHGPRKNR